MIPKLLVSVRDVREAVAALRGGCDVVDVKEPSRGPLGMADAGMIQAIARCVTAWNLEHGTEVPLSVALGDPADWAHHPRLQLPPVDYLKLGTAGLDPGGWAEHWQRAMMQAESCCAGSPRRIVAAYADFTRARGPACELIIESANDLRCAGFLIDTYGKAGGSLANEIPIAKLYDLQDRARRRGLKFAVAGSLHPDRLDDLRGLSPDFIGVRGAVCVEGRDSSVSSERVAHFRDRIASHFPEVDDFDQRDETLWSSTPAQPNRAR